VANEPVIREVRIACTPARAFSGFTQGVDAWWPGSHRRPGATMVLEPGVGGRFLQRLSDGGEVVLGEVVAWEPPDRLAYTWLPGADEMPTHVEVRFEADGAGTRVRVIHSEGESGLGDAWRERAQRFVAAWGEVLPAWTAYMARS
jgi:uncharacterized protein YndB with AHSA1/START domain